MGDAADSEKNPEEASAVDEDTHEVSEEHAADAAEATVEGNSPDRGEMESPGAKDDDNDGSGEETEEEEEDATDVDDHPAEDENVDDNKETEEPIVESREDGGENKHPTFEEEGTKNAEASYSTRGRGGESALDILAESSQREAEAQLPRDKEAVPTLGPSFLSDSLTEEERRTRTRYIPNVEGMNMLRKQEIKGDVALARCMTTSAGVATTIAKKIKRGREDDMDADDAVPPSDEDKASEILRLGTMTVEIGDLEYVLPSSAFLAPSVTGSNSDVKGSKPNPPNVVEAVAAFNPPRPPESVGPKKKHRMLRWERRPADIEVDLNTYRKTVQDAREELQKAMLERDRIEMLDNHLRRHFLNHLECLDEEFSLISEETAKVQQACISVSDLITSRTRSRGAGKSTYVMRDVLSVVRARGVELFEKGVKLDPPLRATMCNPRGVGGVGGESFKLSPNTKQMRRRKLCTGWASLGDKVMTPYGEGEIVKVLPHGKLDPSLDAPDGIFYKPEKDGDTRDVEMMMEVDRPDKGESAPKEGSTQSDPDRLVAPRLVVRLPYGMGFFPPEAVEPIEDVGSFSDSRLALRWRGLMDTAPMFGEVLDIEAMGQYVTHKSSEQPATSVGGDTRAFNGETDRGESGLSLKTRFLPFGSDLIPTFIGRGALLSVTEISELDTVLDQGFFRSACVLGCPSNQSVPPLIKESEEKQQERLLMKAKLRQLKNEVNRQRRIRQLNQRTFLAAQERAARIDSVVAEMRADLRSLKRRLDEEVHSLGINDEEAEKILLSYYNRDEPGNGEESPFKRSRQMDLESEDEDGYDDDAVNTPTQEVSV